MSNKIETFIDRKNITNEKSLLDLIREKRQENKEISAKNEYLKQETEILKSENQQFLKYLEDKKAFIENNIIDLFQFYQQKENEIIKEQNREVKRLDQEIENCQKILEAKVLENKKLEEEASEMETLIKNIKQQNKEIKELKNNQKQTQIKNQEKIFELIDKLNSNSDLESVKKDIDGKRSKYKEAAIEYLEKVVKKVVEENKDLRCKFNKLRKLNEECKKEKDLIIEKSVEEERERIFRNKLFAKLDIDE